MKKLSPNNLKEMIARIIYEQLEKHANSKEIGQELMALSNKVAAGLQNKSTISNLSNLPQDIQQQFVAELRRMKELLAALSGAKPVLSRITEILKPKK